MDPIEIKQNITAEKTLFRFQELRERTMKVTEALYRTTDLFSDMEPLKWSLRDSAVKILSKISSLAERPSYDDLRGLDSLTKEVEAIFYKLNLASGGTFVARANFDVLEREYHGIKNQLTNYDTTKFSLPAPIDFSHLLLF